MSDSIALLVGLGNPGQQYQYSRHNAGALFLARLCESMRAELRPESKFQGLTGRIEIAGQELRLLFPTTYMNNSGRAVAAIAQYYKVPPARILVAYDELDLPLGTTRLKSGGGPGGHNGMRDIIKALGDPGFLRLRFGIGHPGDPSLVLNYVLGDFSRSEAAVMADEFDKALSILPLLVQGKSQMAMHQLHSNPLTAKGTKG